MAKHHCLSVTSGKEGKCIFVLTMATTLLTPRDQEKVSECSPVIKGTDPPPGDLVLFEENQ